jgi:hypothetical protein
VRPEDEGVKGEAAGRFQYRQFTCPSCKGEEFKIWKPLFAGYARAICVHCLCWTELRPEQLSSGVHEGVHEKVPEA